MRLSDWIKSEETKRGQYPLLFGALIGALVVSIVWLIAGTRDGSSGSASLASEDSSGSASPQENNRASDAPSATASDGSTANSSRSDPAATRLYRCQEVYAAQIDPLAAAADAMPQWQVHIAAMNKLVLGVITLQQANQFWNQTRVGAREYLHAFTEAIERFDQRTMHCLPVGPGPSGAHLERCERAVSVRNQVLEAARVALRTWAMHIRHMEMLRHGMMSPTRATQLWIHSWHEGQEQVNRYGSAARVAHAAPRC